MQRILQFMQLIFISIFFTACEPPTRELPQYGLPMQYGWETTTYQESNLDSVLIASALREAGYKRYINSILIARNGKLVVEKYFNGFIPLSDHNLVSVSKSILSGLIGIAIDQGYFTLDSKMMDYFPEYDQPTNDPVKYDIDVRQLLTHTAGLQSEGQAADVLQFYDDQMAGIIYIPLDTLPGTSFRYTSLGTHLLSGILTNSTGMSSIAFANYNLLEPMEISIEGWTQDSRGYYSGGSGMFFTTRNLAAFGQLYLNKGTLNGNRIISEQWVETSTTNLCFPPGESWEGVENLGYGYLWWTGTVNNKDVFFALGYGGQFLFCVPEYELIIAITANSTVLPDQSDTQELGGLELITDIIIPAVLE